MKALWHVLLVVCGSLMLLAGCLQVDPSTLPDALVEATATACGCNCYLYGSYPHTIPSGTPTPTGTWVPPTATRTPTPTRPPAGCDFCTLPPQPTPSRPAWPPPIVTCSPRPDEPTLTGEPTEASPLFPTFPPNTPLPAAIGNTAPVALGSVEGEAQPGNVALDPRTGQPLVIWAQLNPDPGQETAGRIYLKRTDAHGQWLPARSVQGPGWYKVGRGAPESAVGIAPDGHLYVVYTRQSGPTGDVVIDWRESTDDGQTWSVPATFTLRSSIAIYNLRLVIDAAGLPHVGAVATVLDDPVAPSGDVLYFERLPAGTWREERRPVVGRGGRQHSMALTTFPLPDGTIRTVLALDDDYAVYTALKDGPGGAWQAVAQPLIDGGANPYGIPDYWPGGIDHSMQLLAFPDTAGHLWVLLTYSLYSTGRVCLFWNDQAGDGSAWSGEEAIAYNPIFPVPPAPTPFVSPAVYATVHQPAPFYDRAHNLVFIIYQFCDRAPGGGGCFPVYAYAPPGGVGADWTRAEDPLHEPLRLFRSTRSSQADTFRVSDQHGTGSSPVALLWRESTGVREVFLALVWPSTLLSGSAAP